MSIPQAPTAQSEFMRVQMLNLALEVVSILPVQTAQSEFQRVLTFNKASKVDLLTTVKTLKSVSAKMPKTTCTTMTKMMMFK